MYSVLSMIIRKGKNTNLKWAVMYNILSIIIRNGENINLKWGVMYSVDFMIIRNSKNINLKWGILVENISQRQCWCFVFHTTKQKQYESMKPSINLVYSLSHCTTDKDDVLHRLRSPKVRLLIRIEPMKISWPSY